MVELDALEKRCTGNGTVGSNPTSSAKLLLVGGFSTVYWINLLREPTFGFVLDGRC